MLALLGFRGALLAMAAALLTVFAGTQLALPGSLGRARRSRSSRGCSRRIVSVNVLSAARFFLFGARDVWFVVGVPVFLYDVIGWSFAAVGAFLALWVIGYGVVQSVAPLLIGRWTGGAVPDGRSAVVLALLLSLLTAGTAVALHQGVEPLAVLVAGLGAFGVVFALNSAVHSYLILAYSDGDKVAMNVGFYYMANAGGRLVGTLLSGVLFQLRGVGGCLWGSAAFAVAAAVISVNLPRAPGALRLRDVAVEGAD